MALVEQISCDVCGKQKQKVNHWLLRKKYSVLGRFEVLPWDESIKANPNFGHLCGQSCAVKALSEWMASQSEQSK